MDRREFLCAPALTGTIAGFYARQASAEPQRGATAGHITLAALAGDCVRLAMCSRAVSAETKDILARNLEVVRIGGLVRLAVDDVPVFLDARREKKASDREMALVLGSLIELSAARFTPALRADAECDFHRDVALLREMAWPRGGPNRATPAEMYDLLLTLETRRLIGIHTFSPDAGDVDRWLSSLIQWRRNSHGLLKRYAESLCAPATALARKHAGPAFYSREDGVIRLARNVQNGSVIPPAAVAPALEAAPSLSQYAQALRKGHDYLAAAGAYTARSIDAATLVRRLRA